MTSWQNQLQDAKKPEDGRAVASAGWLKAVLLFAAVAGAAGAVQHRLQQPHKAYLRNACAGPRDNWQPRGAHLLREGQSLRGQGSLLHLLPDRRVP